MIQKNNFSFQNTILILITINFYLPFTLLGGKSILVPSKGITTISQAMINAKYGDTVWVEPGIYKENINISSDITLISKELFKAVIDGRGKREDVVKISYQSTLIGFEIRNGNAGVVSRGPDNKIIKCKIYKNRGSGVICMGHLPLIENNIIVYNEGSGIQALDIKFSKSHINHNTIAFNGNNGITITSSIEITIQNNIITSNYAQGIKINPPDNNSLKILNNNFYENHQIKFYIPANNFAFDPQFTAPKRKTMDFSLQSTSQAIKRGNDGKNLGALVD